MASLAVTYTFTNGTVASASEVNQNFQDVIDGTSDGTVDFNIAALTAAGTATLNGSVLLGNASGDDIQFNGSMATSLPIKTQRTYDIGSADLGLRILYLGGNSTHTIALQAPSSGMAADYSLSLPATAPYYGAVPQGSSSSALAFVPGHTLTSAKSADYTITDTDGISVILMTTGGTDRTITLPTLADNQDRVIVIKKIDGLDDDGTGKLIIDGESTETIDGDTTVELYAAGDNIKLKGGASRWEILKMTQTEYLSNSGDPTTGNADNTSSFKYGIAGNEFPSSSFTGGHLRRIRCLTAPKTHTTMTVEVDAYDQQQWQTLTGGVYGGSTYVEPYRINENSGIGRLERVSSTDFDVNLGRYAYYSANNWAAAHANMNWRIKKQTII